MHFSPFAIDLEEFENHQIENLVLQRYGLKAGRSKTDLRNELKGVDPNFVRLVISAFSGKSAFPQKQLQQFPIATHIDYLERTHKLYLHKKLPEIGRSVQILHMNYQVPNSKLILLDVFFKRYAQHLEQHIEEEEKELFPLIMELEQVDQQLGIPATDNLEIAESKLRDFLLEHTDTESDLQDAQHVIRDYQPSSTNQSPYRILLGQLENLELDLTIHRRIEEEVLLPKAIELVERLRKNGH